MASDKKTSVKPEITPGDWARLVREMEERGAELAYWTRVTLLTARQPTISALVAHGDIDELHAFGSAVWAAIAAIEGHDAARAWTNEFVWDSRAEWTPARTRRAIRALRTALGYPVGGER